MEAVTVAITKAFAKLEETAVKDAYDALTTLIQKKFGEKSELAKAIENLENRPDSAGRKELLNEEIVAAKAHQDREITNAAESLIEKIKA
ncbi:hypothetical protein [Desulfonema magnum]|uniref:Uncharacterized protein n=1 Tax=Desulfonema magnum TaxID=45655 RepID=A0A975BHC4_9BACT|nr:hypothetical protein [Desulfonema magnum]QTA85295.1 Uncharacterized protein dnm_013000 [Desulfonema magnum]